MKEEIDRKKLFDYLNSEKAKISMINGKYIGDSLVSSWNKPLLHFLNEFVWNIAEGKFDKDDFIH